MARKNKKLIPAENRKYLRLDTVFPVQFRLQEPEGEVYLSGWLQGFTNNISPGGICLAINNLDAGLFELFKKKNLKLSLEIDIPISRQPIRARASVVWVKDIFTDKHQYLVGVNYDNISAKQNNKFMRYAWLKKLFV
ncbi:MAG: PilZ domain-containing protein, partial [Candidatus Methanoperedens sp.]|nr:PilZ domain-containing protein [Candidatus Methanoperedens sp.]